MKTIAVITPSQRDFNMHVLSERTLKNEAEFVHVNNLNMVYGLEVNDYVNLTNKAKMPNVNTIVAELQKRIK